MQVVKWGAQYLVIGFAAGDIPSVRANLLLVKNVTMHVSARTHFCMKGQGAGLPGFCAVASRQVTWWHLCLGQATAPLQHPAVFLLCLVATHARQVYTSN